MITVQERLLGRVEEILNELGYEIVAAKNFSNCGTLLVYENEEATAAIGEIGFDFQNDTYTFRIARNGKLVPSQRGRSDYYDFHQRYTDHTEFWQKLRLTFGH